MPKVETVFFTVCYPKALIYLDDFFQSLLKQTDRDFDVLVVNDSCGPLESRLKPYGNLQIIEVPATGSLAQVRQIGFDAVFSKGYKQIVFGDFDDCFSPHRVVTVKMLLKDWDIVVNDLNFFGNREEKEYFSQRIKNGFQIHLKDILEKNFMGFSNTAARVERLKGIVLADTIAVDWYLFSRLLARGAKAVFCAKSLTDYRQHTENMAVFAGNNSRKTEVKSVHYQALKRDCPELIPIIEQIKVNEKGYIKEDHPFWWEG